MTKLGDVIRKARTARDLTLQEAAEAIGGISAMALSKIETGKTIPTDFNLEKLAAFYSLDYSDLVRIARSPNVGEESQQARIARTLYSHEYGKDVLDEVEKVLANARQGYYQNKAGNASRNYLNKEANNG